jgi:putative membrane protein
MFSFLIRWVISAVSLFVTAKLVPGIRVEDFGVALLAAIVLGAINAFVRPILILLTLPITILTLGLFIFVINALSFYLASYFIKGFEIESFFAALLGSLVVSIVSGILNHFFAND